MSTYYKNELNKITGPARLQIVDEVGNNTKWLNLNAESRAELIEWLNNQPLTLFEKVVKMGLQWDHHASDLYIPVTTQTRELINEYEFKGNVTTFKSQGNGEQWYDIPFAYPGK